MSRAKGSNKQRRWGVRTLCITAADVRLLLALDVHPVKAAAIQQQLQQETINIDNSLQHP